MGPPRHRPAVLPACLCVGPWPCRLRTRGITYWIQGLVATQSQGDACRARQALYRLRFCNLRARPARGHSKGPARLLYYLSSRHRQVTLPMCACRLGLGPAINHSRHHLLGQRLASHPVVRRYLFECWASPGTGKPGCLRAYVLGHGHANNHSRLRLLGPWLTSHPVGRRCLVSNGPAQAQASCAACVPQCWALAKSAYVLEESPPGYKAR